MADYYVYILASRPRTLYVGVTNDLNRRLWEHRNGDGSDFTRKYRTGRLVYFETTANVQAAITREKQVKGWIRKRKVELIESMNPTWEDLSTQWN